MTNRENNILIEDVQNFFIFFNLSRDELIAKQYQSNLLTAIWALSMKLEVKQTTLIG